MFQGMKSIRNHRNRGFSLVELLVGVAIGALLVGMGIPGIQGAMKRAKQAGCASNMRQIGQGILLYAGENNERLPSINCVNPDTTWIEQLQPYLGTNYTHVRVCPADPRAAEKKKSAHGTSYVMNERVEPASFTDSRGRLLPGAVVFDRLIRIPQPSRVILMFVDQPRGEDRDHMHVAALTSWNGVRNEIWVDPFGPKSTDGTAGSSNYLFADGRVESIAARTVKERVDRGEDISKAF